MACLRCSFNYKCKHGRRWPLEKENTAFATCERNQSISVVSNNVFLTQKPNRKKQTKIPNKVCYLDNWSGEPLLGNRKIKLTGRARVHPRGEEESEYVTMILQFFRLKLDWVHLKRAKWTRRENANETRWWKKFGSWCPHLKKRTFKNWNQFQAEKRRKHTSANDNAKAARRKVVISLDFKPWPMCEKEKTRWKTEFLICLAVQGDKWVLMRYSAPDSRNRQNKRERERNTRRNVLKKLTPVVDTLANVDTRVVVVWVWIWTTTKRNWT